MFCKNNELSDNSDVVVPKAKHQATSLRKRNSFINLQKTAKDNNGIRREAEELRQIISRYDGQTESVTDIDEFIADVTHDK